MTIEQFRSLYEARPFRRLIINLADGRRIPMEHREFVLTVPGGRTVVVAEPDGRLHILDLLLVTDLETAPSDASSPQAPR